MNGKAHAIMGATVGVASAITFAKAGSVEGVLASIPLALAGAKLPDVDHKSTKQGKAFNAIRAGTLVVAPLFIGLYIYLVLYRELKFQLAFIVIPAVLVWALRDGTWFWQHRHGTHTLFFPIIFAIAAIIFKKEYRVIAECLTALNFGYLSHLLADLLTVKGAPVLYPIIKSNISFTKVKSAEENKCKAMALIVGTICVVISIIV